MSGHSKWANIQHRKKRQDTRRGKVFTRLIRELTVAAREGGADPAGNSKLRLAMDKAMAANMGKDNIERAIRRGAGGGEDGNYERTQYEGYGPGGAAILVECATDNRNRTVAEVRHAFDRGGGSLGETGSVAYLFRQRGVLRYPAGADADAIFEAALEAGAEDVVTEEDGVEVLTEPAALFAVRDAMAQAAPPQSAELVMVPEASAPVGVEDGRKLLRLLDLLQELDDVQEVHCNADFPEELTREDA